MHNEHGRYSLNSDKESNGLVIDRERALVFQEVSFDHPKKKYEPDSITAQLCTIQIWQPGCHSVYALDPWFCAPVFRLVCLYQML
jgi:hypothetical protein